MKKDTQIKTEKVTQITMVKDTQIKMAQDLLVLNKMFKKATSSPVKVGATIMARHFTLATKFRKTYGKTWLLAQQDLLNK